jgi:hypothetical protein
MILINLLNMYYIFESYKHSQVHLHLHDTYRNNFSLHRLDKSYIQMVLAKRYTLKLFL